MRHQVGSVEEILAKLATASHGVVTHRELRDAGITPAEIRSRVRRGSLIPEYRGIYRVGHTAPSDESRYLAAVRAGGPAAVLSGLPAAYLLGLLKGPAPRPEISVPTNRRVPGVRSRRVRELGVAVVCRGVPVTSVPQTLVDVASALDQSALARACHEAGARYRITPRDVAGVLARRPKSSGARRLRRVLEGDTPVSLSRLESCFLARLGDDGLPPPPHTNRDAGGRRVDCRWPEQRLTVEVDSYRYHSSRHAWERDRQREREAYARGDDLRRYTYDDVFIRFRRMLAELRPLLIRGTDPT
jgi:Transcriptional regulator, AbiEi antitoxin